MSFRNISIVVFAGLSLSVGVKGQKPSGTKPSTFTVQGKTETPDGVLKQGSYSISIADHLADRMIIEIQSQDGKVDQKFLGVPAKHLSVSSTEGPSLVTGVKGQSALRGFAFSNGSFVEFVYLKNDAVALAKANGSSVLAVDPSSEGLVATKNLSPDDMKIVTLWLLTPKPVGPNDQKASIQAERYQPPAPDPSERAEVQDPPMTSVKANTASATSRVALISKLPKTASELPLLMLLGGCLFMVALSIRFWIFRSTKL